MLTVVNSVTTDKSFMKLNMEERMINKAIKDTKLSDLFNEKFTLAELNQALSVIKKRKSSLKNLHSASFS